MATRLVIRSGRLRPASPPTLADLLDAQADNLLALVTVARDDHRSAERTEQLLDAIAATGAMLVRLGRGG